MNKWSADVLRVARRMGILEPHESVLVGTPQVDEAEQQRLGRGISSLLALIVGLPARFGGDLRRYGRQLGFSDPALDVLLRFGQDLSPDVFARADLVRCDGRWQVLELNVGSSVGGMFYTSLPRLAGHPHPHDALRGWAERIHTRFLADRTHVAIVEDPEIFAGLRPQFAALAEELAAVSGVRCSIVPADHLHWNGTELSTAGARVDCVYRFFNEHDVLRSPSLYRGPLAALTAGAITMPMGPHYNLINNKGVLAMLWDLYEQGRLSVSEAEVVRKWLAPTLWLSGDNMARIAGEREQWVLKPIDGACGRDVWCGQEMSDDAWGQRLSEVLALGPRRFVAQRFASPEQAEVAIAGPQGEAMGQGYKIVWGVYVFGEDYLGLLVRAKPPEGTAVINHATGAVVGPLGPLQQAPQ